MGSPPKNIRTSGSPSARDEGVDSRLALLAGERESVRLMTGVGEADRAIKVAVGVHLDESDAGVLLVVWAQAAVERATLYHFRLGLERQRARLVEPQRIEVHLGIAVEQGLELAVLPAAFAHEHRVVPNVHLGVDHPLADRADALRQLDEDLVAIDARRGWTRCGSFAAFRGFVPPGYACAILVLGWNADQANQNEPRWVTGSSDRPASGPVVASPKKFQVEPVS